MIENSQDILFEDEYFLAVNKQGNQFIHPMPGERDSKHCLLFFYRDLIGKHLYPINRLDRPVSGIVLLAKAPEVVTRFQEIWNVSMTHKKYLCLHRGELVAAGQFDSPLSKMGAFKSETDKSNKQEALTLYWPQEYFSEHFCTLTEVEIKTGRYHQIRRHFRKAIMPLIGDRKHGKGTVNNLFRDQYGLDQIFLHCHQVSFIHPYTQSQVIIDCPLPHALQNVLNQLRLTKKSGR